MRRRSPLHPYNHFEINGETKLQGGRIGKLIVHAHGADQAGWIRPAPVETPHVFPVINVIGGPPGPGRNGGLWRPVKWWMFLNEKVPAYLCQVLHVLDFNIHTENWDGWKDKEFGQWIVDWQRQVSGYSSATKRHDYGYPFRPWMRNWEQFRTRPGFAPKMPVTFLDSGGFTLMKKDAFQKAKKWYRLDTTPQAILGLQKELGGDLIASLDFPLPPGLTEKQIKTRQRRSIANAARLLRLLATDDYQSFKALPYVAVHGTNAAEAEWYLRNFGMVWSRLPDNVKERPFGFAIGSMVPRADDPLTVIEVALGVRRGINAIMPLLADRGHTPPPVHMFGITSHLMWFLVYLGVDTFDSSTFADVAKRAGYLDEDLRAMRISEVTDKDLADCGCPYCNTILEMGVLGRMQEILDPNHPRPDGVSRYYQDFWQGHRATNSDVYGLLAMHNYHRIQRVRNAIVEAIKEDKLAVRLVEMVHSHHGQRGKRLKDALAWLAAETGDPILQEAIRSVYHEDLVPPQRGPKPEKAIHLRTDRRPHEFTVPEGYRPPAGKKVLLLLACSKGKPYRTSTHQQQVLEGLQRSYSAPSLWEQVHKVTLSGLYGPVPEELEDAEPVTNYNFMLERGDIDQAKEVANRLRSYLKSALQKQAYEKVFAYIYFPAYREVVEKVFKELGINEERIFPAVVGRGRTTVDYREELFAAIGSELGLKKAADAFVLEPEYAPPPGKEILLLMPSPGRLPYADAGDQKSIVALLQKTFPEEYQRIHRVTLSALYGPVPDEREGAIAADTTTPGNVTRPQWAETEQRLRTFLANAGHHYRSVIAYVRAPGYRDMVMHVLNETGAGVLVPSLVGRELKAAQHQEELLRLLVMHLHQETVTQLQFAFE